MEGINQFRVAALLRANSGSVFEGRPPASGPLPSLTPGATVEAKVVGQFGVDGLVLDIDGHLFQSRVPDAGQRTAGDRLPLVVLRGGDVPTFLLNRGGDTEAGTPSTHVELSALASRLGDVLAAAQADAESHDAAPDAAARLPLVGMPPADDGVSLQLPLQHAIEDSGLFYESHLADWVVGKRPMEALRNEPQAAVALPSAGAASDDPATTSIVSPGTTDAAVRAAVVVDDASVGGMTPQIAHLVDRQLQTLSGQPVTWSGFVWPGQWLDWTLEEDAREGAAQSTVDEASTAWTSTLRLTLPALGVVELRAGLNQDRLTVRVVSQPGATDAFRQASETLRTSLAARGLTLTGLQVSADDDTA